MRANDWPDLHRCASVGCGLCLTSHIDFKILARSRLRHRDLDDVRVPPQNSPSRLRGQPGRPPNALVDASLVDHSSRRGTPWSTDPSVDQHCSYRRQAPLVAKLPAAQRQSVPLCPVPACALLSNASASPAAQCQPVPRSPALTRTPLPCDRVPPAAQRQRVPRCPVPVRALLPRARAPLSCPASAARACPACELVLLLQFPPARCPAPCPASAARACPAAHSCCCCSCRPHAALHHALPAHSW
ncbi:unnamed protein product [Closterium sp. NIES-54]